ncbi:MAG: class I SAM-dependent methyltransferase [Anaerolineae bacterium]|nr:class I SAM-dependent methyltransferase [Anaerolineae bacterium]
MSIAPEPTELELEQAHYDALYADTDARKPLPAHVVAPQEIEMWNEHVGSLKDKQVLECGSGDGEKAVWLASRGAFVQAVELSPVGVERTLERARAHGMADRVKAYVGDCTRLQDHVLPNSIDLALGFSVLHHFPAREFGCSLRAVLRPGGRAVFFENSNANPLYRWLRGIRNNESVCGSPLTQVQVRELVAQVGGGYPFYPRFGLFGHAKKYVWRESALFAGAVDGIDRMVDAIPGTRRWSSHMWVILCKPVVAE